MTVRHAMPSVLKADVKAGRNLSAPKVHVKAGRNLSAPKAHVKADRNLSAPKAHVKAARKLSATKAHVKAGNIRDSAKVDGIGTGTVDATEIGTGAGGGRRTGAERAPIRASAMTTVEIGPMSARSVKCGKLVNSTRR